MLVASRKLSPSRLITLLVILLPAVLLVALLTGPVFISPFDLFDIYLRSNGTANAQEQMILSSIRLPRLLLGCFIGISLAVCGAAMQGLFRNPLADPSLIGVTSGASAGASCVIVLGGIWLEQTSFGLPLVALGASLGGLIAVVCNTY